jgi:phospholipid/cholesterol/gamma-HCH transport system substrate-binding protein
MKQRNLELTVGLFVFMGLVTAAVMIVKFGSYEYREKSYPLTATFAYTNGVILGAPIRLAGVEVGKVTDLRFSEDETFGVEVHMDIRYGTVIREDAKVLINALGLMGEKYIEFLPQGTTAPILQPGATVRGITPVALNELLEQSKKAVTQVSNMISGWADPETQKNVKEVAAHFREMTGSPNKENIAMAVERFKNFSGNANTTFERLDAILAANNESLKVIGPKIVALLDSMEQILKNVEAGEGTIGKLVKDDAIHKDIKDFVSDIKANPWKLFFKTEEKKPGQKKEKEKKEGCFLFF